MNTDRANTKLFIEFLKTHEIMNQYFIVSFERIHTTSGTIVFQRKNNGKIFRGKFVIINVTRNGRIDILAVLLKNKFHFNKKGVKQSSNFITCEAQYFQDAVHEVFDIM